MRVSLELPAGTVEWIRSAQSMVVDLTAFTADACMVAGDNPGTEPTSGQWSAAEWSGNDIRWLYAGNLTEGLYVFWVRVNGVAVTPIRPAGIIRLI
jgi:hypothetical protein